MHIDIDNEQKIGMIVPNGKHIKKAIMGMLDEKGYENEEWQNGLLHVAIKNEPVTLTFQHQVDVIGQVSRRIFKAGWVGSERLAEHLAYLDKQGLSPEVVEIGRFRLFPPRLRLSFLVRDNEEDNARCKTPADLRGARIVTGTPTLAALHLAPYFPGEKLPVDIDLTHGGEEGQVYAHYAEAALVVVDSGDTMRNHSLRELKGGLVMRGIYVSAIANIEYLRDRGNRMLLEQAMGRLQNGRRSRTGFLMPKLPIFSDGVVAASAVPELPEQLSQDISTSPVDDSIRVSHAESPRTRWESVLRLIPGFQKAVIASTMLFTLLPSSVILNPWHSKTSKEKDLRN